LFIRLLDDLRRSLEKDVEITDRESITVWLMQFASGLPLELHHPVMGSISYRGVKFSGSVLRVYDRYVFLQIEDIVEKHVRQIEAQLEEQDTPNLAEIASRAAGLILANRQKLRDRAESVKGRLLTPPTESSKSVALSFTGVEMIDISARLNARVEEIQRKRKKDAPAPVWGGLERFARSNPALANIISFGAGVIVTLIAALVH